MGGDACATAIVAMVAIAIILFVATFWVAWNEGYDCASKHDISGWRKKLFPDR